MIITKKFLYNMDNDEELNVLFPGGIINHLDIVDKKQLPFHDMHISEFLERYPKPELHLVILFKHGSKQSSEILKKIMKYWTDSVFETTFGQFYNWILQQENVVNGTTMQSLMHKFYSEKKDIVNKDCFEELQKIISYNMEFCKKIQYNNAISKDLSWYIHDFIVFVSRMYYTTAGLLSSQNKEQTQKESGKKQAQKILSYGMMDMIRQIRIFYQTFQDVFRVTDLAEMQQWYNNTFDKQYDVVEKKSLIDITNKYNSLCFEREIQTNSIITTMTSGKNFNFKHNA